VVSARGCCETNLKTPNGVDALFGNERGEEEPNSISTNRINERNQSEMKRPNDIDIGESKSEISIRSFPNPISNHIIIIIAYLMTNFGSLWIGVAGSAV